MRFKNSAVTDEAAQKSTTSSKARLTPQQAADLIGRQGLQALNERIAKIARGEKVPEQ